MMHVNVDKIIFSETKAFVNWKHWSYWMPNMNFTSILGDSAGSYCWFGGAMSDIQAESGTSC